jgi:carbonic anhydrase
MSALLEPEKCNKLPAVKQWLGHAEATARIIRENYTHIKNEDELITVTVEENVLVQLENLRTHPSVAAAIGRGDLKLHGWVHKFESDRSSRSTPKRDSSRSSPTARNSTRPSRRSEWS